jgi:radical SAM protein with 4Fe4S-binding SPASM domain
MAEGRLDEASTLVEEHLASVDYARGRLLNTLGVIHARGGRHDRAQELFELVLREHPQVTQARGNLRTLQVERERAVRVIAEPELATSRVPQARTRAAASAATPPPDSLLVEITTYCNMKCPGCVRTIEAGKAGWQNRHMSPEDFRHIVETMPTVRQLIPQGIGEPSLHPHLPELLRTARGSRKFHSVTFITNGLAREPAYYARLFESGLTGLTVSVDSLDAELAEHLRAGTSVERLKTVIRFLAHRFPRKVNVRSTVSRLNAHAMPRLARDLSELAELTWYIGPYEDLGDHPDYCLGVEERREFRERIESAAARCGNLRVEADSLIPKPGPCRLSWTAPAVTVEGYLTPCCRILDRNVFNYGSVLQRSFSEVWNSQETQRARRRFHGSPQPACATCTMFE